MKYHISKAQVTRQDKTAEKIYLLSFEAPEIAHEAKPGQFVHIKVTDGYDPLLRRPISICSIDLKQGLVTIWYQVVGKGTELLSHVKKGDTIDVMGPLGRCFDTELSGEKTFLIGGGMGIAPLLFLAAQLEKENKVTAFFGGRNRDMLEPVLELTAVEYEAATEDGSVGYKGFVTELLQKRLETEKPARIYACGPHGMLEQVARLAKQYSLPLQVSLETVMACGVGACLGCTCEKGHSNKPGWAKVCKDGPVFWEQEVKLL